MTMQIAQTILAQLGGGRFLAMTGAKDLVGGDNTLRFRLPARFAKGGITHVHVTLDASDTYTVKATKWQARKLEMAPIAEVSDVYAEDLRAVFTDLTGLDTGLR